MDYSYVGNVLGEFDYKGLDIRFSSDFLFFPSPTPMYPDVSLDIATVLCLLRIIYGFCAFPTATGSTFQFLQLV